MDKCDEMMFGCDMDEYKKSVLECDSYQWHGGGRILVSMLSDVQEMIIRGQDETARQLINRVKHLIMEADDISTLKFEA